jgi:hypothetical protein
MFYVYPVNLMRTTYPARLIRRDLITLLLCGDEYKLIYENFSNTPLISPFMIKYYVSGHYPSSCLYLKHRPVYISKHSVSEIGFSLRLQVKSTQLGPVDRASPYLRTPAPTQDRVQKPSTAQTIFES